MQALSGSQGVAASLAYAQDSLHMIWDPHDIDGLTALVVSSHSLAQNTVTSDILEPHKVSLVGTVS